MSGDAPEGFLGRWSRIKRSTARAQPDPAPEDAGAEGDETRDLPPAAGPQDATAAAPQTDPAPDPDPETGTLSEEELAALPRIEDLVAGSDIRPFLRAGVPRSLRNAALRRMWMVTPAIRDYRDPAVDYAWDWNTPGGVPGDGVAPSPERAAQMLRSILSPKAPAPADPQAEEEGQAAPGDAAAEPPDSAKAPPADPDPTTEPPVSDKAAPPPEASPPADSGDTPPPRPRHGSALPR